MSLADQGTAGRNLFAILAEYDAQVRKNNGPGFPALMNVAYCDDGPYGAFGELLDIVTDYDGNEGLTNAQRDTLQDLFVAYQKCLRLEVGPKTDEFAAADLPKWVAEHGAEYDVPREILDADLEDLSWHNDACPKFGVSLGDDEDWVLLFVLHPDPARRDANEEPRFAVWVGNNTDGTPDSNVYEGDDIADALAVYRGYVAVKTAQRAARTSGLDPEPHLLASRPGPKTTLTAGEIIAALSKLPSDMPVTVGLDGGAGWLNIEAITNPFASDEPSAIIMTADDFDTRQF
jgi:hypothetical protein